MGKTLLLVAALTLTLAPALASAHPPAFDPHNSCVVRYDHQGTTTPLVLVQDTLSYLWPKGRSLPCPDSFKYGLGPTIAEWGSHAGACPPPPFEGAINGAYCGPVIPPWPATATCAWFPLLNSVPTGLIIGFDGFRPPAPGVPGQDGFVNFMTSGEAPVYGPFPPSPTPINPIGWTVPNPYGVQARVIAFPTNTDMSGRLAPGDLNLIQCD